MQKNRRFLSLSVLVGVISLYFATETWELWLLLPLLFFSLLSLLLGQDEEVSSNFFIAAFMIILMVSGIIPTPFLWFRSWNLYFGVSIAITILYSLAVIGSVIGLKSLFIRTTCRH